MKRILGLVSLIVAIAIGMLFGSNPGFRAVAQSVPCYLSVGGTAMHAGSGCTWQVESGGVFNVASGGALKIGGTDRTTALSTAPAAVAAGYRIARGETPLGGTNPTAVTTGLSTITGCSLTLKVTSAPGLGTSVVTYGSSSGTMNMYAWKPTSNADPTLIASTGTETIGWVCVGT